MNGHFTAHDIIWIKNVSTPTEDAYMKERDIFNLHFPDRGVTNPGTPDIGEIILLYQNINNRKVFTHLVSPIDNVVGDDNTRERQKIYRNVRIIARTPPTQLIKVSDTLWNNVRFGGFGQGNVCRIRNIESVADKYGENYVELLDDIRNRFLPFFRDVNP